MGTGRLTLDQGYRDGPKADPRKDTLPSTGWGCDRVAIVRIAKWDDGMTSGCLIPAHDPSNTQKWTGGPGHMDHQALLNQGSKRNNDGILRGVRTDAAKLKASQKASRFRYPATVLAQFAPFLVTSCPVRRPIYDAGPGGHLVSQGETAR